MFLKSGNQCSFPSCCELMVSGAGVFIVKIVYSEVAEEGGERFNESMSDEDRRAVTNAALS